MDWEISFTHFSRSAMISVHIVCVVGAALGALADPQATTEFGTEMAVQG